MFDFGDELTVESYRIPWLIWIQLVVMFLLILLLYCLAFVSLDPTIDPNLNSPSSSSSSSSSSSTRFLSIDKSQKSDSTVLANLSLSHNTQVCEIKSLKGEMVAGTSRRDSAMEEREDQVLVGSNVYFHPCFYFRLARTAFLKCLGLDSPSESCSATHRRKKKEE